jgi:hypothetical protein
MVPAAVALGLAVGVASAGDSNRAPAWPTADAPAYPASPFHGVPDGNGRRIPCTCRFQGRDVRLGELVCMSTHLGVVLTRCDLLQNNTSWIPTGTPCTLSSRPLANRTIAMATAGASRSPK